MDNESHIPIWNNGEQNEGERNLQRINAIGRFEFDLQSLSPPIDHDSLKMSTEIFVGDSLDLDYRATLSEMNMIQKKQIMPSKSFLYQEPGKALTGLRLGLYDYLVKQYAVLYDPAHFREWIEPFMRFVLDGHIYDTAESIENHPDTCAEEKCPATIIQAIVTDDLKFPDSAHVEHEMFTDGMINMNVSMARLLVKFGIMDYNEVENLLDEYQVWLDYSNYKFDYNRGVFYEQEEPVTD